MERSKVEKFIAVGGQGVPDKLTFRDEKIRALGAQLLLSEVLEYVIKGLGVVPEVNGQPITDPDSLTYRAAAAPDKLEMLDGISDVAYTMFWNAIAFGLPLEAAFDAVCDNNLEKFVRLEGWQGGEGALEREAWSCERDVRWPEEVSSVEVVKAGKDFFAVGKDSRGKVRKPLHYRPVNLLPLFQ